MNIGPVSPFFIVRDAVASSVFYEKQMGFEVSSLIPEQDPFFAVVRRGSAQFFLKSVADEILPVPNSTRHDWAPWDAFIHVNEPSILAEEFIARETHLHRGVIERDDGLFGFEVQDHDGYVLFFGRTT